VEEAVQEILVVPPVVVMVMAETGLLLVAQMLAVLVLPL
jgi:hypothetical protein